MIVKMNVDARAVERVLSWGVESEALAPANSVAVPTLENIFDCDRQTLVSKLVGVLRCQYNRKWNERSKLRELDTLSMPQTDATRCSELIAELSSDLMSIDKLLHNLHELQPSKLTSKQLLDRYAK